MKDTTETQKLDQLIELRAKSLADKIAEVKIIEFKKEFLAKFNLDPSYVNAADVDTSKKSSRSQTVFTKEDIAALPSESKLKQVYDIFQTGGRFDRHDVANMMEDLNMNEVSYGTICGRIGDLLNAEVITEVGYHTGKFGKKVAVYGLKR